MRKSGAFVLGLVLAVSVLVLLGVAPAGASYLADQPAGKSVAPPGHSTGHHHHGPAGSHPTSGGVKTGHPAAGNPPAGGGAQGSGPQGSGHGATTANPGKPGRVVNGVTQPGDGNRGRHLAKGHTKSKTSKKPKPAPAPSPAPTSTPPVTPPVPLLHLVPPSSPGQFILLSTAVPAAPARALTSTSPTAATRRGKTSNQPAPPRFTKRPLATLGAPALSVKTADHLWIPITFGLGVALFILLQALVDRRDPKVSNAPQHGDDDSIGFE